MIETVKRFFYRRSLRAFTDDVLASWAREGIITRQGRCNCNMCGEAVVELVRQYEKLTLSGERLTFHEHLAYACRRCQAVGANADCSGFPIHVAEWRPRPLT